jgi:hypothetical protein
MWGGEWRRGSGQLASDWEWGVGDGCARRRRGGSSDVREGSDRREWKHEDRLDIFDGDDMPSGIEQAAGGNRRCEHGADDWRDWLGRWREQQQQCDCG